MTRHVWPRVRLGDVIELLDHKRIPLNSNERRERQGPYPYYGAQGVIDSVDNFIFDGEFILLAEDGENLNSRKLPLALRAVGKFWVNNHAHVLRGLPGVVDDRFLLAAINSADIKPYVTGAAQPKLSQANLRLVEFALPPLPVQRRIAGILAAYDELIENCERRIRVLDEMARALYREWFVHFRYPGHEKTPLVDSPMGRIPRGWRVERLDQLVRVHRGRSYRSTDLGDDGGVPFVNLKCLDRDGGFRRSGVKRFVGTDPESHAVRAGDIVVAVTDMTQERRIVARAALVPPLGADFGVFSMDLVRLEPLEGVPVEWVYGYLRYSSFADHLKLHANGANVLHLSPDRIRDHSALAPPGVLRAKFAAYLAPLHRAHDVLENRAENLRATRDLLLPRLLSGQLSVEAAE